MSWLGIKWILEPLHTLKSDHLVKWVSRKSCLVNVPLFVCLFCFFIRHTKTLSLQCNLSQNHGDIKGPEQWVTFWKSPWKSTVMKKKPTAYSAIFNMQINTSLKKLLANFFLLSLLFHLSALQKHSTVHTYRKTNVHGTKLRECVNH